jgi:hypothetical protein
MLTISLKSIDVHFFGVIEAEDLQVEYALEISLKLI